MPETDMLKINNEKKIIAWGRSKLLEFYVKNTPGHQIAYVIDSKSAEQGTTFNGLSVRLPEVIRDETKGTFVIVVFAVSTNSIQNILRSLNGTGLLLGQDVLLYSDLMYEGFAEKARAVLGRDINPQTYELVKSFSLNSRIPVHTTLLGNVLFLELLSEMIGRKSQGLALAEIGAFNGGNAILASQYMAIKGECPYYVFDSFEGFPTLSQNDPRTSKAGDYAIETSYEHILDSFSMFPFVHVIKGFVPQTFSKLDDQKKYGLIFYDCDLYDPALSTFQYFWDRIEPGGYMLIHDYFAEEGGFQGVRMATEEFFGPKGLPIHEFWENTMCLIVKPH